MLDLTKMTAEERKIYDLEKTVDFLLGVSSGWLYAAEWLGERAIDAWADRNHRYVEFLRAESDAMMKKYKSACEEFENSKKELAELKQQPTFANEMMS